MTSSDWDSFDDQLFPGTSTIQTRLRYMPFVPWIYHSLEEKRLSAESFAIQADKLERDLVEPLMDSDDRLAYSGKPQERGSNGCPAPYIGPASVFGEYALRHSRRTNITGASTKHTAAGTALKYLEEDTKARGDDTTDTVYVQTSAKKRAESGKFRDV